MKRLLLILLLLTFIGHGQSIYYNGWRSSGPIPPTPPNLALQGFGKNATGALPGDPVVTVTNTNTSGAGSLANAISGGSNRTILFSIPGAGPHVIPDDFTIASNFSYVTIDGTGEIIIIDSPNSCGGEPCNDGMSFENASVNHIIVKNIHFRDNQDGANVVDGAHDIAFMNCAFWLNWDGNVDVASNAHNVTIQYCVIGNHTNACHCGSGGAGGTLITGYDNTVHHNLYNPGTTANPDEGERMPFTHGNYSNAFADVRNNIVYNYGRGNATGTGFGTGVGYNLATSDCGCYGRINAVNNYYYTPSTAADQDGVDLDIDGRLGSGYSAGNVSGNGFNFNTGSYTNHAEWPVTGFAIDVETACEAVSNVLAYAGPDTKDAAVIAFIAGVTNLGSCSINRLRQPVFTPYDGISYHRSGNFGYLSADEMVGDIRRKRKHKFKIYI